MGRDYKGETSKTTIGKKREEKKRKEKNRPDLDPLECSEPGAVPGVLKERERGKERLRADMLIWANDEGGDSFLEANDRKTRLLHRHHHRHRRRLGGDEGADGEGGE